MEHIFKKKSKFPQPKQSRNLGEVNPIIAPGPWLWRPPTQPLVEQNPQNVDQRPPASYPGAT